MGTTKFLSFDIDDTVLAEKHQTNGFYQKWNRLIFNHPVLLCYNTGRLMNDTLRLIENRKLPAPQYIISGVGTSIYDYQNRVVLKEFNQILEEGWDRDMVEEIVASTDLPIRRQPSHYQNAYKSSWFYEGAAEEDIKALKKMLKAQSMDVNVIYSSNIHLDILPRYANKGNALEWLLDHLDIPANDTIVAGNSGNDAAMYGIDEVRGIVVANAQPELKNIANEEHTYLASASLHEGVLEGLHHHGLQYHEVSEQEESDLQQINLMEPKDIKDITAEQYQQILEGYEQAVQVIKKNITPIGFSACSLDDNETSGTDVNYKSVWARDGSITITGTLSLIDDPEILACQRRTLETLLHHVSPSGQTPSNVRIETQEPDYSGVGGICSIDGGLWLIIAFHDFVKATGEIDFLRKHQNKLAQVMNWLSAQDGNNDALLEIPEAGDWTDLFGRSYNVLYDEVLWYRVNVCYARLMELLGDHSKAGDYMSWSEVIKQAIIKDFWPTTQPAGASKVGFDEQQYSLGDARYLIAQVTPFDFSWRCDVYGNVLAHLYHVVDKDKAMTTFRFIWGAGANEPFPVQNVYPAVSAGDPDWRPYYTVNLLNLPHHYHNGGIWPFVGGAWVRNINKLGLHHLALKELYKLSEINKLGVFNEWEFNEWAHGVTGRPMGKAYQAWSAAEYIHACHDLQLINK